MKNTTIAIDEFILEEARKYASNLGLSFNAWVNQLITNIIRGSSKTKMDELFEMAENIAGDSKGTSWTKDEIYER